MKYLTAIVIVIYFGAHVVAFADERPNRCYALSQIGYDSVINGRLGVPITHLERLTDGSNWDKVVVSVVRAAYQWDGSPQGFADRVYLKCKGVIQ